MRKIALAALLFLTAAPFQTPAQTSAFAPEEGDKTFPRMSDEFLRGYLRWRPAVGSTLGFHEYDGKVTDYSGISIEIELSRLKSFDQRLADFDSHSLSRTALADYRILRNAIKREIFSFEAMQVYSLNA